MKIKDRLNALCELYRCELDDDGESWTLWLPEGMEWRESQAQCLCERYSMYEQSWKPAAIKELEERAAGGVSAEPVATLCPVLDCYGMG
jgi:hypothetical protein